MVSLWTIAEYHDKLWLAWKGGYDDLKLLTCTHSDIFPSSFFGNCIVCSRFTLTFEIEFENRAMRGPFSFEPY